MTNLIKNIILSLFSLALVISVAELSIRLFYKDEINRYINPDHIGKQGEGGLYLRPSSITAYEYVPNQNVVNSFGFLSDEYPFDKAKGVYRILVLGDSILADRDCMPDILLRLLNSENKNREFEVWNAGLPGINVRQYAEILKHKGIPLKPDMVLIGFCIGDFHIRNWVVYKQKDNLMIYDVPFPRVSRILLNRFLFKNSHLYRFLALRLERKLFGKVRNESSRDSEKERGLYYLDMIKQITTENKIPLIGVIFPWLMPYEEYTPELDGPYRILIEVLDELEIDYIDLHTTFQPFFTNKGYYEFRDPKDDICHPNTKGHEIAADVVYNYLQNNYLK